MTPLIQATRTIMHLGETVPEAEQARPQTSTFLGALVPLGCATSGCGSACCNAAQLLESAEQ